MQTEQTMSSITDSAQAELRDRWENYRDEFGPSGDYVGDVIHEIADSAVPVYTANLMQLAADDINLATAEPEIGPAFDGSPTPVNIIAANVYEAIEAALWETWREIEEADAEN